ncbi:MAG: glycoside hydrolase family 9 protein [Victivallales bacterium]|nr:glycoside hydrolase family 9 protein [Victivallales bacterium]
MNRRIVWLLLPICLLFMLCIGLCSTEKTTPKPPEEGHWKCVALDARHLALTGDYAARELDFFTEQIKKRSSGLNKVVSFWSKDARFRYSAIEAIAESRSVVVSMLRDNPSIQVESDGGQLAVTQTGYWLNPVGQSRFPDENGKDCFVECADVAHYLFLTLSRPLAEGEHISLSLPTGEKISFPYSTTIPTPLFKINQVGYMPSACKYAYLGAWLGTAGTLPLHQEFEGKPFQLVDATNGQTVFSGKLRKRFEDPKTTKGTPFSGEEVLELDFSKCKTPGSYYLAVAGIGRSEEFCIGDDTMLEAFFIHARGLFHQRCGIAKEAPYTHWTQKKCHLFCYRGNFPPNIGHYGKGDDKRPYGFRDGKGKSITVKHFQLIKENVPEKLERLEICGGWHDAADWDRRPQHLGIVGDLTAVYLLKPQNFVDGQLNIPESGNGIPDILDEAIWGLDFLRQSQQTDGGVGTWIETTRHPGYQDGMASDDKLTYYVSCATRNSTLEYAAYASELALALKQAGAEKQAELFRESATLAWNYAQNKDSSKMRFYNYNKELIYYLEEPELAPEFVIKAGGNLFHLWNDKKYLYAAEDAMPEALKALRNSWAWSPFFWIELEVFPTESIALEKLRGNRAQAIVREAKNMLRQQEENYPIRIGWRGPGEAWVHTMGWGNYHPLRRARTLVAAHAISGDVSFWEGACLANDFNNGANPLGSSMTSGLGRVYPVQFLHLDSYSDGIAEFVPGITPYSNTYGIPRKAITMAFGLFYSARPHHRFKELKLSFLPEAGLSEGDCANAMNKIWPIWRRWGNVESQTVAASEFTVWETIAPAVAVTGYLLNGPRIPKVEWLDRKPATDIRQLPGFSPLP